MTLKDFMQTGNFAGTNTVIIKVDDIETVRITVSMNYVDDLQNNKKHLPLIFNDWDIDSFSFLYGGEVEVNLISGKTRRG